MCFSPLELSQREVVCAEIEYINNTDVISGVRVRYTDLAHS